MSERLSAKKRHAIPPRCSAAKVLRAYTEKLINAIQNPELVSVSLYSKWIITEKTHQDVLVPGQPKYKMNMIILEATRCAIEANEDKMDAFLAALDHHTVENVVEAMRKDMDHSTPHDVYYETCQQLVCKYCTIDLHQDHVKDCKPVTEIFPEHKQKIERHLQQVKQKLSDLATAKQVLKERADQISAQGQEVEQQIHTTTQQVIKDLQESERQLREEVRTGVQLKLQLLSQQIETVESNQVQLKSCREFVEKEVRVKSQQQVLTVERQMMERMRAVSSQVRSSELQPLEEANITFTVNKSVLSQYSKLGEVNPHLYIASRVVTKGKGKESAIVGQMTSLELTTTHSVSLPPNLLSCQLTAPNSSQPMECTITPTQPGSCTIHCTPAVRGPHQLKITVGGSNIPSSPFTVHVLPSPEMRSRPLTTIPGLNYPWGVAVSKTGEVVVSERGDHCISVFNREGKKIRSFGSFGSGRGQFNNPSGIALTCEGHLLVADAKNHRLQVLTLEGKFITSLGEMGKGPLEFNIPRGITVHPSGKVFITDSDNHHIQVLNTDLTYSHMFGSWGSGQGEFNRPLDVSYDSHGDVYVADRVNNRVQKFTSDGRFISSFGSKGSRKGQLKEPTAICIDSTDMVYVGEGGTKCVSVFNSNRQFLKSCCHVKKGDYFNPHGLAVDKTGDLFVCDINGGCVHVY